MKNISEGNLYNVQQSITRKDSPNASKTGLEEWNRAVRKELMQKLRGYSPKQIDLIIKNTFGDTLKV